MSRSRQLPPIADRHASAQDKSLLFRGHRAAISRSSSMPCWAMPPRPAGVPLYKTRAHSGCSGTCAADGDARPLGGMGCGARVASPSMAPPRCCSSTAAPLPGRLGLAEGAIDLVERCPRRLRGAGEFYPEDFLIPFAGPPCRRPVKWIEDRREQLMTVNHARGAGMPTSRGSPARATAPSLALRGPIAYSDVAALYAPPTPGGHQQRPMSRKSCPAPIGHSQHRHSTSLCG